MRVLATCLCALCACATAYVPLWTPQQHVARRASPVAMAAEPLPRRRLLFAAATTLAFGAQPQGALAADGVKAWVSGKPDPLRPTNGKEKPDGTKKDYKYVQCLNDCVPRKQGPPGPNQKDRVDCLDACQQECCFTYEQCVTPRLPRTRRVATRMSAPHASLTHHRSRWPALLAWFCACRGPAGARTRFASSAAWAVAARRAGARRWAWQRAWERLPTRDGCAGAL